MTLTTTLVLTLVAVAFASLFSGVRDRAWHRFHSHPLYLISYYVGTFALYALLAGTVLWPLVFFFSTTKGI